jgi:hypothetical protein
MVDNGNMLGSTLFDLVEDRVNVPAAEMQSIIAGGANVNFS